MNTPPGAALDAAAVTDDAPVCGLRVALGLAVFGKLAADIFAAGLVQYFFGAGATAVAVADLFGQIVLLVGLVVGLRMAGVRSVGTYLGWKRPARRYLAFALALAALICALDLLATAYFPVQTLPAGGTQAELLTRTIVKVLGSVILAPLVEESWARGFLWRSAQPAIGGLGALLLTTAAFVILHGRAITTLLNFIYGIPLEASDLTALSLTGTLVVSGLGLGLLRWMSGGTTAPMVAHCAMNASTVLILIVAPHLLVGA